MSISEKDIKKLWGLSAGICSHPQCDVDCIVFIDESDPTIVGEMAHIIAKEPNGPRGSKAGGSNNYDNLILLCPNHHTLVDKAPEGTFPVEMLLEWKVQHEKSIRDAHRAKRYPSRVEMAGAIKRLLIQNHKVWLNFGPESAQAKQNPLSNLYQIWDLRKLGTIVPNNNKIVSIIKTHEDMFEIDDYEICCEFIEHAAVFERSCYSRVEGAKRFPKEFQEVINKYAKI